MYLTGFVFLAFLLVATIVPNASFVGKYGEFLGQANFALFGYMSYLIPIYFSIIEYGFYKNLDSKKFEQIFAGFLIFINLLIIQSLLFEKGAFGNIFVEQLKPLIGVMGISLLVLSVFILVGFILKLEFKMANKFIKKNEELKSNFDRMPVENEKIEIPKEKIIEEYIQEKMSSIHKIDTFEDIVGKEIMEEYKKEKEKVEAKAKEEIEEKIESKQEEKNEQPINEEEILKVVEVEEKKEEKKEILIIEKEEEKNNDEEGVLIIENDKNEIIPEVREEEVQEETELKELQIEETETEKEEVKQIKEEIKEEELIEKCEKEEIKEIEKEVVIEEEIQKDDVITEEEKVTIIKELEENKELLNILETGKVEKPDNFVLPKLEFLTPPSAYHTHIDEEEIDNKVQLLLNKLRNFKIDGDVVRTYTGPVVTTFEFKPLAHIKVSKILNLQDDLAMALKASTIRIQAPIPGKDVVGIEIPNNEIETIYLREILESDLFKNTKSPLAIALGKDIVGKPFVTDLAKLPHLLIAGTTGSGKSVGINAMILSLLYRNSPDNLKLMMIDPKMLEFSIYNEIPHLLTPVITDAKKAIAGLNNMVKEMERRYKLMSDARVKNIENYNEKFPENKMPFIVVIIDELADLMMNGGKDVEYSIARLAQMARASGIHLIVATQRPSVDVVTGLIKANLPSRISYKVGQKIDSKVILDQFGAESLLGRGDMLFTPPGMSSLVRLHAPFTTENEIEKIVEFLKSQKTADYDENFLLESVDDSEMEIENKDDLFEEAKQIILNEGKTSISYLQRRLQIGYNRAANIIEQLELSGFLSAPNSKGQREILG